MVLELARRGVGGTAVALTPRDLAARTAPWAGFLVRVSIALMRALLPVMPWLTGNPVTRTLLFSRFLVRPWALSPVLALRLVQDWAAAASFRCSARLTFHGPLQHGAPAGSTGPVVIGWGRNDRATLPKPGRDSHQAVPRCAAALVDRCGHLIHVDAPEATVRLILGNTA